MLESDLSIPAADLSRFAVDAERGFLPSADPLRLLPGAFDAWEQVAADLPKLLVSEHLRPRIERMPLVDPATLPDGPELERAMMLLSYLGHAYVWGAEAPPERLPSTLAVPWHAVASRLGRPPVLSYASYALHNWRRIDPAGPVALGSIALLQNFLGGQDEEWFILVHVDIEARAVPALAAIGPAQQAVARADGAELDRRLGEIDAALERMLATLARMPERCDPHVYFHRVRPYIHGWKDNPALPNGLVYDGVADYAGRPQLFRGETGAQSSIIPALDAALGISHRDDPLKAYLLEMRDYMPPRHRAFIDAVSAGPSIRQFVLRAGRRSLTEVYDACVRGIERFRATHLDYAMRYIFQQEQRSASNLNTVGTGGTPFGKYLKKHRDETAEHVI